MAVTSWAALRELFLAGYDGLTRQLARKLGSEDLAAEAMQDTYLRLQRPGGMEPVANPSAYLYRVAVNTAINRRIAQRRLATAVEISAAMEIADEAPGPDRAALARIEMVALERALAELPKRCRDIFVAGFIHGTPHAQIASRFDVSLRTVRSDLQKAVEHCAFRLEKK
jgi:RNA polymerase sigma-70 factor (ECF subfamily)